MTALQFNLFTSEPRPPHPQAAPGRPPARAAQQMEMFSQQDIAQFGQANPISALRQCEVVADPRRPR